MSHNRYPLEDCHTKRVGGVMQGSGFPRTFAIICREVTERGWRRVILLGEDPQDGPYSLKACLAQSGVLVLSPGPDDRAWLQGVARKGEVNDATLARFAALLADGVEHGVQAVLATDAFLGRLAQEAGLEVPVLMTEELQP